jgi:rhomboid protease GluP
VLIYVVMVIAGLGFMSFYTRDLLPLGALFKPNVQKGEWWRLVTCMFLHGGLMHLFMNMFSLYISGIFLESLIGTKKFIIGYFIAGIVAGLISLWWHDNPVVSIGASGAIFGLHGILLSMILFKVFDSSVSKMLLILLASTAGYSIIMGMLSKGIDNSAHIGGLLTGVVMGVMYAKGMLRGDLAKI